MNEHVADGPPIWGAFCGALGSELREGKEIRGASGLVHPVEAIGVDDKGKRVVIVSSEINPRISALMRGDVQETLPNMRVLVARPLAVDLAHATRKIFFTDNGSLDLGKLFSVAALVKGGEEKKDELSELIGAEAKVLLGGVKPGSLRLGNVAMNVVEQISTFDWSKVSRPDAGNFLQTAADILTQLSKMDNLAGDREHGICPVPTYELTEADWNLLYENKQVDEIQERLKSLDIFQFFFPPADRLALSLMDRGVRSVDDIASSFDLAQAQGHELSDNVIVKDVSDLRDILNGLREVGYVMEGEFSTELTADGEVYRESIKVRPGEGVAAKLAKIVSVKFDFTLKDLMGGK